MLRFDIISSGMYSFDSAAPRTEFGSNVQRVDDEGVPIWAMTVIRRGKDDRRSEFMTVSVPFSKNPADVLEPFTPISFEGLQVMTGENNGRTWVSFSATSFSTRTAAKPAAQPAAK